MKDKFIKPYCIKVKYFSISQEQEFELVDLYLKVEDISGFYVSKIGQIVIMWKGSYLDCEYNKHLLKFLKEWFNPISLN